MARKARIIILYSWIISIREVAESGLQAVLSAAQPKKQIMNENPECQVICFWFRQFEIAQITSVILVSMLIKK